MSSLHSTECTWSVGPMGCIGGADRIFACKSQECLWQDWYICIFIFYLQDGAFFLSVYCNCSFTASTREELLLHERTIHLKLNSNTGQQTPITVSCQKSNDAWHFYDESMNRRTCSHPGLQCHNCLCSYNSRGFHQHIKRCKMYTKLMCTM